MAFPLVYAATQVQDICNGTAVISVAKSQLGGGPPVTGWTTLGLNSSSGIQLNIMHHTTDVYNDARGPGIPAQKINNGVDAYATGELYQYDQQVLFQFMEQRADGNDPTSNLPTGFAVNTGELMYDSIPNPTVGANVGNTFNLTSSIKITAPRNVVNSIPYSIIFPRCHLEADVQFNLSTQLLTAPYRIYMNPDASGYLYYRITSQGTVQGYTLSSSINLRQGNITIAADQGRLSESVL